MNILITGPSLKMPGGVANYLSILLDNLTIDSDYFVVGSRKGAFTAREKVFRIVGDYLGFLKKLLQVEYDLVHLNPSFGAKSLIRDSILMCLCKMTGKKTIVFFRGWNQEFAEKTDALPWRVFRNLLLRADAIIVLADSFEKKLREWGYRSPIFKETTLVDHKLTNGITMDELDRTRSNGDEYPVVLFLSRIERLKGVHETVQACRKLRKAYPGLRLLIAGEGTFENELRELCRDDAWIKFTGFVEGAGKRELFCKANLYILASYSEGMPNSVLEAMAFGLPIVTHPVGGLVDFFEDGKMGKWADPIDPECIASVCNELLENEQTRKAIGQYNFEYAKSRFSAISVASRVENIYLQTINQQINSDFKYDSK